jgi:hypothetical protein
VRYLLDSNICVYAMKNRPQQVLRRLQNVGRVPATLVPNDQLWFHHPAMQARIAKAEEEDFAAGRFTRTATPEEAQDLLDGLKKARSSGPRV